eukprot:6130466-Amphidinium_carterae.1
MSIEVEHEDLADIPTGFLKRRFAKPVSVGIFWCGMPSRRAEPRDLQETADGLRTQDPEAPAAQRPPQDVARPSH